MFVQTLIALIDPAFYSDASGSRHICGYSGDQFIVVIGSVVCKLCTRCKSTRAVSFPWFLIRNLASYPFVLEHSFMYSHLYPLTSFIWTVFPSLSDIVV